MIFFLLIYFFLKLQGENYISMVFFSSLFFSFLFSGGGEGSGGRGGGFFIPLFKVVLMWKKI